MLFRKPRPPKLEKIDLTRVSYPDSDSESISSESSNNEANYNTKSSNSTEREFVQSSFYLNKHGKRIAKIELPRLSIQSANNESVGEKSPKTMPNSVLGEQLNEKLTSETDVEFYSKTFGKNTFKSRMSPIRSAELYHKERKETFAPHVPYDRVMKPKGSSYLPVRPPKYHHDDLSTIKRFNYDAHFTYDNSILYPDKEQNENFRLNDFLISASTEHLVIEKSNKKYTSNSNYRRINNIFAENLRNQQSAGSNAVHVHTLIPEINPIEARKPTRQSLIEMAAYLKGELKKKTGANLKTKFQPISKWQRLNGPQTELVIYEEAKVEKDVQDDSEITPSQIAILDCLLRNGDTLSLKSYFIDKLPDLKQLKYTIRYINLSFNNFKEIPTVLLTMRQLETIKMRSNPIKYITDELCNLQNLKVLNFSYCQLNEIPFCILELHNLQHLDLSYNRIKKIDNNIENLKTLRILSLEGNEIEYMPSCMLQMTNLQQLNVKNNYLHPLIWRKLLVNSAQSLFTLSAVRFMELYDQESEQYYELTEEIRIKLRTYETKCECCNGKRFDEGLKIIRPHIKIFQVKYLPFLFYSCSPKCLNKFKTNPMET